MALAQPHNPPSAPHPAVAAAIVCTRPSDTTGYTIESETLDALNFNVTFAGLLTCFSDLTIFVPPAELFVLPH